MGGVQFFFLILSRFHFFSFFFVSVPHRNSDHKIWGRNKSRYFLLFGRAFLLAWPTKPVFFPPNFGGVEARGESFFFFSFPLTLLGIFVLYHDTPINLQILALGKGSILMGKIFYLIFGRTSGGQAVFERERFFFFFFCVPLWILKLIQSLFATQRDIFIICTCTLHTYRYIPYHMYVSLYLKDVLLPFPPHTYIPWLPTTLPMYLHTYVPAMPPLPKRVFAGFLLRRLFSFWGRRGPGCCLSILRYYSVCNVLRTYIHTYVMAFGPTEIFFCSWIIEWLKLFCWNQRSDNNNIMIIIVRDLIMYFTRVVVWRSTYIHTDGKGEAILDLANNFQSITRYPHETTHVSYLLIF